MSDKERKPEKDQYEKPVVKKEGELSDITGVVATR